MCLNTGYSVEIDPNSHLTVENDNSLDVLQWLKLNRKINIYLYIHIYIIHIYIYTCVPYWNSVLAWTMKYNEIHIYHIYICTYRSIFVPHLKFFRVWTISVLTTARASFKMKLVAAKYYVIVFLILSTIYGFHNLM